MKKILPLISMTTLLSLAVSGPLAAENGRFGNLQGCELKEAIIKEQREYAQKYGNDRRDEGLEKALGNVNKYCNDDALKGYLQNNIDKRQAQVDGRQQDLEIAKSVGHEKSIKKAEKKLQKANEKLDKAKRKYDRVWGNAS